MSMDPASAVPLSTGRAQESAVSGPCLLPGAVHFQVIEEPAYAASGSGEHLFVEIEKEGLTTDAVARDLARACQVKSHAVGFAGRKDRHGITRQWFSVLGGVEEQLHGLERRTANASLRVVSVSRHRNKIRPGHLAGNRFVLGLGGLSAEHDLAALEARLAALAQQGISNRFGSQRFGVAGSSLRLACALGQRNPEAALAIVVDPLGTWKPGDALPQGHRFPPEGDVLAALRRGAEPRRALAAGGDTLRKLAASAAQAAVFNAVLAVRVAAGIGHRLRVGDLGCTSFGAPFLVTAEDLDATNARCAPGVLDAFATAPLPGTSRLAPAPEVDAEERAWSAATGVDWAWFGVGGALESPGLRRPLFVRFRTLPAVQRDGDVTWLSFALPAGSYATEVLDQLGIAVPADRRGGSSA